MTPQNLWIETDGKQIKYQISIDPEQMDLIIATELRQCYEALATEKYKWPELDRTKEALLVVLEHYMSEDEYNAWYETIKEL